MGKVGLMFQQSVAIANQVKICRVLRPDSLVLLEELASHIEEDFA
jgi:hypothetical protein